MNFHISRAKQWNRLWCMLVEKSHQLPYPCSSNVSSQPLELVFSDVWGPAPTSVGINIFYVSFIDDFSKFTWIYYKSEVFRCFRVSWTIVQSKDSSCPNRLGWRVSKAEFIFFQRIAISRHVSCPHVHQQNCSAEWKYRHIVGVGLSLLAQASMPSKFSDERTFSHCHIFNKPLA